MSCSGLHCAGCGAGASVPPIALAALLGATWLTEHLIEVAAVSAACGILSIAAVVWLMRWQDRRQAAMAARGSLMVTRLDAAPLPPPARRELPQVVILPLPARPVTFTQLPRRHHDQGTA